MRQEDPSETPGHSLNLRREVTEGLLYAYGRLIANTGRKRSRPRHSCLIELLSEKGVITVEELDEPKRVVAQQALRAPLVAGYNAVALPPP